MSSIPLEPHYYALSDHKQQSIKGESPNLEDIEAIIIVPVAYWDANHLWDDNSELDMEICEKLGIIGMAESIYESYWHGNTSKDMGDTLAALDAEPKMIRNQALVERFA